MAEMVKRSFRSAGLELAMSQGFHPQPKLSFMTALPVGVASLDECIFFSLRKFWTIQDISEKLVFPVGLSLVSVKICPPNRPKPKVLASRWAVSADEPVFASAPLLADAHLSYTDPKRGSRHFSLKDFVLEARAANPNQATLTVKIGAEGTPKPLAAARVLWSLAPELPLSLRKLATIMEGDPLPDR
jgi:radical SAM-linked protein